MCGIAGRISRAAPLGDGVLRAVQDALSRRGPDGQNCWNDREAQDGYTVQFVHARLALVDTSVRGNQPMTSSTGKTTIIFNGEIYNHRTLRSLLETTYQFQSSSDTEVILALYERDGIDCLASLEGMFAFALWDHERGQLFVARDRMGKKPLFYSINGEDFSFASEVKALFAQGITTEVDWEAIRLFLALQYVPSPKTGFKGISSLEPGHYGVWKQGSFTTKAYDHARYTGDWDGSKTGLIDALDSALQTAVCERLDADVEIGLFLSGGIDSSLIAAVAKRVSSSSRQTFTLGFKEKRFDERDEAMAWAQKLGFTAHTIELGANDLLASANEVLDYYDQPFADSSSLAVWHLARGTKPYVKGVLTGDGGDELFAGYPRYRYWQWGERGLRVFGSLVSHISAQKARRLGQAWQEKTALDRYLALFGGAYFLPSEQTQLLAPAFAKQTERSVSDWKKSWQSLATSPLLPMLFDQRSYLPDDLLVKADRATMAWGVEARSPLLDQRIVALARRAPPAWHLTARQHKPLLMELAKRYLPNEILSRKKRGFQLPLAEWFRGDLGRVFEQTHLKHESALHQVVQPHAVRALLQANERGENRGNALWMLYSLGRWLERYV